MSSKATTSLNAAATQATTQRGAGPTGTVAAATTTLVKATATTPTAVIAAATHLGTGTTPPATAANFDRTVATSLGK